MINGNTVSLQLEAIGVAIVKPDGDGSGATGHFHVFVDRDPVPVGAEIPKEPTIIHTTDTSVKIPGLSIGSHHFFVVLGDGTHHRVSGAMAETTVTTNGPSLQATAPALVQRGEPVTITVSVSGVNLIAADGDTSGKSGHLHYIVDKQPPPAGQPVPKEPGITHTAKTTLTLTNLAQGQHVIWVVLGNGAHIPFDPPVEDKVTVTVQ
ncbi:MAG: DUF4399 domain-containing protein [Actinomycetota bacterium]|nr:DUF4399 domain-containing protein [Actinomycetota bacterium]